MEIFPTLKTSLTTLVRKVRSGLTAGRDETQPEMIAVVRLSVRRGVRTRIDVHMQLYMALFTLFAISFAGLIWVAALVIVLFMQLTVIPIVQWEALLRHAPQELLPSLFAVDPETWVRIRLFFEQVVGNRTCYDAMQGGKKVHQLSNDEDTVLRECESTEEVKRIDWYGTHRSSPEQFIIGSLH